MTPTHRSIRNVGIDVLRGVSILTVILLHLNLQVDFKQTFLGDLLPRSWYSIFFWSGFYGVAMFFVISGYLITNSTLKKWKRLTAIKPKVFYLMRFARIMPLLVLLLTVLSLLHLFQIPGFVISPDKVSLTRTVFAALTFHINWLEIQVGYLPANWDILWSLSIEEVFYLFFPLICILAKKEWHFVAIVMVFFAISPWARVNLFIGNELGDRNHFAYIDAIAIGCITALIANRITIPQQLLNVLMCIGFAMVIFIFAFRRTVFQWGLTQNGLYITVLSVGISLVILWMHYRHTDGRQCRLLLLVWLQQLGQYSYEIYLTHIFVIIACVSAFKAAELSTGWIYFLYIAVIAFTYILGMLTACYFSNPINRWIRKRWL